MFEFTEEQLMIRDSAREFAQTRLAPSVVERDRNQEFRRELFDEMGKLGFTGIIFPEEYGGTGGSYLAYILACEEIARVDAGMAAAFSASTSLGVSTLFDHGTPEQKEKFGIPLAKGEKLAAFALTESGAGTDSGAQKSVAVLDGDHYVLNGSKTFITNADDAEIYIVLALTDPEAGARGITAFILEKGTEGFTFGKKENKMGVRTSKTMDLEFKDVRIPVENRLGDEGKGFRIAMMGLDGGRIGIGAQCCGIAQAALDEAAKYSKERKQFGKPISINQGISFKIAEVATELEAARLLTYKAAALKEAGKPYSIPAAMTKLFASDMVVKAASECLQIFGGIGYSEELPMARFYRDAKITQIYEGTSEVQRMVVGGGILAGY
jgi:butyryl-CoA dehydrogenase